MAYIEGAASGGNIRPPLVISSQQDAHAQRYPTSCGFNRTVILGKPIETIFSCTECASIIEPFTGVCANTLDPKELSNLHALYPSGHENKK
jgi:hypothetical protein